MPKGFGPLPWIKPFSLFEPFGSHTPKVRFRGVGVKEAPNYRQDLVENSKSRKDHAVGGRASADWLDPDFGVAGLNPTL